MDRFGRFALIWLCFVAVGASFWGGGASAQEAAVSADQQLVDRYLPVIYVREHEFTCARPPEQGEPYLPVPVEMVLGNERVLLRDGAKNDMVIGKGVDAVELARHGEDTYLDFPGDPRQPGCTYETDERIQAEELGFTPTTYARIVIDEDEGRLALQYWFFWYFNEWNNTHEADWEMIQIMWDDASSVEDALAQEPSRAAFSQHSAGERGTWGDDKIELVDGTHPTIFSAAGSHASFYSSRTFLQWGENNSGFGCDLTTGPSTRVDLTAKLVEEPIDPQGEFAWLLYPGRWGERQISVFNGVNGPGYNDRWIDPWGATDNWPDRNIVVPDSKALGPTATSAFCSFASMGSELLIFAKVHPWVAIPGIALVAAAIYYLYQRSRDIFRRAIRVYRNNWRVFVGIGLVAIPIGVVFNLIEAFTVERAPVEPIVQWLGDTAGAELSWVLAVGGIQQLAMLLLIGPAVIQAVADIHHGRTPSVVRSYTMALQRLGAVFVAGLVVVALVGIPLALVIGLPMAVWLVVRWQYFGQALMFDKESGSLESLRESARLVNRRWWRTAFAALLFDLLATLPGVLVGFGLLTVGRVAVGFANAASSVLYALLIPLSVIALTVMFLDRRGDPIVVPGVEGGTDPAPGYAKG